MNGEHQNIADAAVHHRIAVSKSVLKTPHGLTISIASKECSDGKLTSNAFTCCVLNWTTTFSNYVKRVNSTILKQTGRSFRESERFTSIQVELDTFCVSEIAYSNIYFFPYVTLHSYAEAAICMG